MEPMLHALVDVVKQIVGDDGADRDIIALEGYAVYELSANYNPGGFWASKASLTDTWKTAAARACQQQARALERREDLCAVEVLQFASTGRRRLDLLNTPACYKAYLDGFTVAGLWKDDFQVQSGRFSQARLKKGAVANRLPQGAVVFVVDWALSPSFSEVVAEQFAARVKAKEI